MKREWGSNFDRQNSLLKRNWQLSSRPGSRSARFKNIPNECKRTHGTVEYVCVYPQVVPSSNTEHTINVLWAQRKKSYYTVFFRYTTIFDKQSRERERERNENGFEAFFFTTKNKKKSFKWIKIASKLCLFLLYIISSSDNGHFLHLRLFGWMKRILFVRLNLKCSENGHFWF